jgi:hypothetical protein
VKQRNFNFRWAVGVKPSGYLELQLQSLPAPATTVESRPVLRLDDIAIVPLHSWPLECEMFDGEGPVSGPVPHLFVEDVEAMRNVLDEEEDQFGGELNAFMRRYGNP